MDAKSFESRGRLLDGSPVIVRAVHPDDKQALAEGFARLSKRSVYSRFFTAKKALGAEELTYLTELDFVSHVALCAQGVESGVEQPLGIGRFVVDGADPAVAEVAITVDERHQGLGVGTLLLKELADLARNLGVREFRAEVLTDNERMMKVFRNSGFEMDVRTSTGLFTVRLSLFGKG